MCDLFQKPESFKNLLETPLAEILRPKSLDDVIGQKHLLDKHGIFRKFLEKKGKFRSFIFHGPSGVGKTTLAKLLANKSELIFSSLNGAETSLIELRKEFNLAKHRLKDGFRTLLFVDEIHRFSKAQQDALLSYIENGTICFIGATTENPIFELNSALLSRTLLLELFHLNEHELRKVLRKAEAFIGKPIPTSKEGKDVIIAMANGDARMLLNIVEVIFSSKKEVEPSQISTLFVKGEQYSKLGDQHFNYVSALQKSIRFSDVNAALYWLARLMSVNESPSYILRRILRTAYEDIGLADLRAQKICLDAFTAYKFLGSPEGDLSLAHAVIYLALAPKSNSTNVAYKKALRSASNSSRSAPPDHLRFVNSLIEPKKEVKVKNGQSASDFLSTTNFPLGVIDQDYYAPIDIGDERQLLKRYNYFSKVLKSSLG